MQQQGIGVEKSSSSFLLVAGFVSDNKNLTQDDISDYVASNVKDAISRTSGVGDVQLFGAQYAMRIWLDSNAMNKYQLTPLDIINQLKNAERPDCCGPVGRNTVRTWAATERLNYCSNASEIAGGVWSCDAEGEPGRFNGPPEKMWPALSWVAKNYNMVTKINGQAATGLGIKLATGANALDTAAAIKSKLAQLQPFFPQGLKVVYPYDTTPFVKISIHEVVKTLFEAIVLVFLVMYLFLQNLRATLIPTIAVPVVLLGTFAVLAAFGFSINTLTMFGMVLAIGLLVDDAIVVVENVERVMVEDKLPPKEATQKSMEQIQGALVGIAMVLSAVFIPMAFFGGSTGAIYRQFSLTIVSAMALSVLVALI